MDQYLYKIHPTRPTMLTDGPTPEEQLLIGRHFEYLKSLADEGIVWLAGRTLTVDPTTFGIVVFRADSPEAARELMLADPAVSGGVMEASLYPFRVALIREPSP